MLNPIGDSFTMPKTRKPDLPHAGTIADKTRHEVVYLAAADPFLSDEYHQQISMCSHCIPLDSVTTTTWSHADVSRPHNLYLVRRGWVRFLRDMLSAT